ncbi:MAG: hypothetical protein KAQ87_03265 [Candidatus Pacebacteria bacterium]|nr:hypothetical protein [Candidatus Paceibacterota bacterium]
MDNKNIDIKKEEVVNLKVKTNISRDEKEDEFFNKQFRNTREFKPKANLTKSLKRKDVKSSCFSKCLLYLLAFLLPLFFLPFSLEIFEFNKTLLLFAISSLAFLVWIAKMIVIDRKIVFVKTPLDIPIIIFIFLILLSTALSVDKISSVLGFYGRFSDSLMVYLSLAMLYFVGVNVAIRHLKEAQLLIQNL